MIDTRAVVDRFHTLESLAVIPRVSSTNLVARRILEECLDNELSLPQAIIVAGEQFAGRGRNERQWSSPPRKGIYATTLLTRPAAEIPMVPLEMANAVATFLRERFRIDARIKWPNDVMVNGRKIAGILIEARAQEERVHMLIGTGVNVEPVEHESRPNAISIAEVTESYRGLEEATVAFVEHLDARFTRKFVRDEVLEEWRRLTIHKEGDAISSIIGLRTIAGTWRGIDEHGRALIRTETEIIPVSAGEIIMTSS
ncbi:MAG TPA: biotin--[acetyl-CoA-carboxylase] ligase [Thermoanaerobaculia bacterium]|nr:biotin--[acetyl-CoA-carboxylase] ligase [Thermoanaerobaculia bacterium]